MAAAAGSSAPSAPGEAAPSDVVPWLLALLQERDLVFIARDESAAQQVVQALQGGAPAATVLFWPASDALPGESAPPSPENVGRRMATLRRLRLAQEAGGAERVALVTTAEAAGRLYPDPQHFAAAPPVIAVDEAIDLAAIAAELEAIGYVPDERVDEPGELAVRGQVIDVFPADAGQPCRIEVQDGRVSAIRPYDPATQLTTDERASLELGRAAEPDLPPTATLLDHVPGAAVVQQAGADRRRRGYLAFARDAQRRRPERSARDLCDEDRWQAALAEHEQPELGWCEPPPRFVELRQPLRRFGRAIGDELKGGARAVLLGSARDLRFLRARVSGALRLEPVSLASWAEALALPPGSLAMLEMIVPRGFRYPGVVAVSAADLLGSRAQRDMAETRASELDVFQLADLRIGDVVVHEDHGIAVVAGLEPLPEPGGDAIVLRFAGEARRLVPVLEADRIWRYGAEEAAVTLDRLDGSTWQKRRAEVSAGMEATARHLVALAAERQARTAPVLDFDPAAYERFAAGFPFTETPDQTRAIEAVRADLLSGRPMDRLIVGDVGFGKTEVALRAAAMAALAGKQVALAAPTTVLAAQHLETFRARFEDLGIAVAGLTRFTPAAEKKRVAAGLADGSIAIVVGTRAVAAKSLAYRDLALVIVDEEQKFGAADKALLRGLGAGHVLTLSATPIPRTLQNALSGLQPISVLATPPARRQPIRTTVAPWDAVTVRTALLRERNRRGQSFVVVPRVEDMEPMAERLARLAPELSLVQAHGKLPAAELDQAMVRFAGGEGDVLLATNIIESGLDVPRANTMLVWRADRFGLSQLHQLRGRVGRGSRRGHIHLLTDPEATIAPRTLARLGTLQAFDRLGAGFAISARDLDLRGAGDLLSEEQTGHVRLIGLQLYQHLLETALRAARGEAQEAWTPLLNVEVHGAFEAHWIADDDLRVGLYVRLARIASLAELDSFAAELDDRFGEAPQAAQRLLALARLRVLARAAGIARVDAGPAAIALTARHGVVLSPLPDLVEGADGRLVLKERIADPLERLARAEALLADLAGALEES